MTRRVYETRAWRAVRQQVLERDAYVCMIRGAKCTGVATQVDHITPLSEGGAPYDMANLRGACRACNAAAGGRAALAKRHNKNRRKW